jgi:uncharacterized protein (TIGR03032 family)
MPTTAEAPVTEPKATTPPAATPDPEEPAFRYVYSSQLPALLRAMGASLLISSYQSGKLVVVRETEGQLSALLCPFEFPMGLAVRDDRIAVGTRDQIWVLRFVPEVPEQLRPGYQPDPQQGREEVALPPELHLTGNPDGCFLPRCSHVTGDIRTHEIAWGGDELWLVNTYFSCLCTLHRDYSFVPRWRPPFVTAVAAGDRCHLNGLAMDGGRPRFVTALGETDTPGGWRPGKAGGGCLIDVAENRVVARGLSMPHSPRVYDGMLWVLDSGTGRVVVLDPGTGRTQIRAELPGFTRGLTFFDRYAFVGLSKIRETSTFGGLPIASRRHELKCGVGVFDIRSGRPVGLLEFEKGVEEVFEVKVLPNIRFPVVLGSRKETLRGLYVVPPAGLEPPPGACPL